MPSKASAGSPLNWQAMACQFALVSDGSAIERQGTAALPDLAEVIAKSQRVVVLLAAGDVTTLRLQVPPLSAAKLKAALPNLVEDRLISDISDCVMVAGGVSEGLRTIAVVQRAWLDMLSSTLISLGARHISALPAQFCLPYGNEQAGSVVAAIDERNEAGRNTIIDMTLRLSEQDGIGLTIAPALNQGEDAEQNASAVQEVIKTLLTLVPQAPIMLYVPQSWVRAYQQIVNETVDHNKIALGKRISVSADNWSRWIAGANAATLDLMAGLGKAGGARMDWSPWRWPLALAVVILVINAGALNIDWWHMKNESRSLRTAMVQIYKSAYPKESVIIDPIAQMQQKIAIAKHDSGLAAPDDFTAITAAFGEAWAGAVTAAQKSTAIAALEYHDRSLLVHLKAGGEAPTQQMQAALAQRNLSLTLGTPGSETGQPGDVVWKIRSMK
ncbi:MAG: type II secretion system protein GspL [Gallionella sp.]